MSMVERIIYDVIQEKLDWFKADSRRFENFLINKMGLSPEEAAKGRIYFSGDSSASPVIPAKAPTLVQGYARTGGPFPCWALTLGGDDISTDYLGHDAEPVDSDGDYYIGEEDGLIQDPFIRRIRYTFNIMTYADHPDVCIWYYQLLRFIVISSQRALEAQDIDDLMVSGRDLAPDPRYMPDTLFTRVLTVTVESDETWELPLEGRGNRVTGIFSENQTSGLTEENEQALITPYEE